MKNKGSKPSVFSKAIGTRFLVPESGACYICFLGGATYTRLKSGQLVRTNKPAGRNKKERRELRKLYKEYELAL